MGWTFRRSVNLGPLRLNLSKSGLGYSVGARGFRVGKDAKGRKYRTMSIPYTGIYRRDYLSTAKTPPAPLPPVPNPAVPQAIPKPAQSSNAGVRWLLYVGAGVVLYALIRFVF